MALLVLGRTGGGVCDGGVRGACRAWGVGGVCLVHQRVLEPIASKVMHRILGNSVI